jgi:hypothetical protein
MYTGQEYSVFIGRFLVQEECDDTKGVIRSCLGSLVYSSQSFLHHLAFQSFDFARTRRKSIPETHRTN